MRLRTSKLLCRGVLAVVAALALVTWSGLAEGQQGKIDDKKPGSDYQKPAPTPKESGKGGSRSAQPVSALTLEQMLSQAVKNHADIRVAEARLREAEALLEQARLLVSQKVIAHYHAIQAQKLAVETSELQIARINRLRQNGAISAEEVMTAQRTLAAEKAKLAELEAQTPLLIGKLAAPASNTGGMGSSMGGMSGGFSGGTGFGSGTGFGGGALGFQGGALGGLGGNLGALGGPLPGGLTGNKVKFWEDGKEYVVVTDWSKSMTPQGSMADRLRKALDTPVDVHYSSTALPDVLEDLKKKLGVPLIKIGTIDERKFKQPGTEITVDLKEQIPLGAAIQAVEDVGKVRFAVREYGVLVTGTSDPQHDSLPPGATPLHEFWKRPAAEEKTKPVPSSQDKDKAKAKSP
jgi:hypothetical protein